MIHIDEVLSHFGIKNEEVFGVIHDLESSANSPFFRKNMGIDFILRNHVKEGKKVRIIIDYDADFPRILSRVISL